jgi:hypothetical protein
VVRIPSFAGKLSVGSNGYLARFAPKNLQIASLRHQLGAGVIM